MFNFFFKGEDHSLFRKALKSTKDEPVIINILSTDSSLIDDSKKEDEAPVARKNLSNKFEPSPFGKFFGPRKQRTTPVDMGNFSSWKNKNFREAEQKIGEAAATESRFSLTDYMNKNSESKMYNDSDQLTSETQKPITQLSTEDPTYKKYSLDSYLHKLEEQAKVKDKFQLNDDLLEPLGDDIQKVIPDSSQDENFGMSSAVNVEDITFDENISGERFAFEKSELDKVRTRLDKIEKEVAKSEKVISGNELSAIAKAGSEENDDFDLSKLGVDEDDDIEVDDIEKINQKLIGEQEEDEANKTTPKVSHKRFFEINKTPTGAPARAPQTASILGEQEDVLDETDITKDPSDVVETGDISESGASDVTETAGIGDVSETYTGAETPVDATEGVIGEAPLEDDSGLNVSEEHAGTDAGEFVSGTRITRDDILTKDDLKTMTDELVTKFTEMYKKGAEQPAVVPTGVVGTVDPLDSLDDMDDEFEFVGGVDPSEYAQGVTINTTTPTQVVPGSNQTVVGGFGYVSPPPDDEIQKQQVELQAKILEMMEANKRADAEALEKLRQAELEKSRVAEQYEAKLRELEESFRKRDEELKKQAYLDKLKHDIKMKKAETKFKKREEEILESGKISSERVKIGLMLKKELENNLNISNLEMDKKLLEVASKLQKDVAEEEKAKEPKPAKVEEVEVIEEIEETPKKTVKRTTTRKKTTTRRTARSHTRTPRRKIDSDIIGGINFD